MKRRQAMKGIILFSLGTSIIYSCTDPYQAVRDLNLRFLTPDDEHLGIIDTISKIVVPLDKIPALADHTALPFIMNMVDDIYTADRRREFREGFMGFDMEVKKLAGKSFGKLKIEEQTDFLARLNKRESGLPVSMQDLFDIVKSESLKYLQTSEYVQRKVNYYEMAPGRFKGNVVLSELQNANKV